MASIYQLKYIFAASKYGMQVNLIFYFTCLLSTALLRSREGLNLVVTALVWELLEEANHLLFLYGTVAGGFKGLFPLAFLACVPLLRPRILT